MNKFSVPLVDPDMGNASLDGGEEHEVSRLQGVGLYPPPASVLRPRCGRNRNARLPMRPPSESGAIEAQVGGTPSESVPDPRLRSRFRGDGCSAAALSHRRRGTKTTREKKNWGNEEQRPSHGKMIAFRPNDAK